MKTWSCLILCFFATGIYGVNAADEEPLSTVHIALYSCQISYPGSALKDDGGVTTGYLRSGYEKTYWEFALAQTRIDYKDGSDLDQTDGTLAYTNAGELFPNNSLRAGIHYIDSDDELTDQGFTLFGKILYFQEYAWNIGLEIDYSSYKHSSTDLYVFQAVPSIGFYLSQDPSQGTLYTESKLYYIHKDKDIAVSQHNFFSFEQSLTYSYSSFDAQLSAWVGRQMFAVKNDGFVVYNLQDRYDGGINFDAGYTIENRVRIGLTLGYDLIKHTEIDDKARQHIVSISMGTNF